MEIQIKRVYAAASAEDGQRVLVDRLWPRGLPKEKARLDYWAKSISPSTELRKWYGHDPEKWAEFQNRYFAELDQNETGVSELVRRIGGRRTTFLFSSKELRLNNASALKEYLSRFFS